MSQADLNGPLLQPGRRLLDRYELVRELGRGGMGVVWLARDETLRIEVACKVLPDLLRQDRAALDELRDEARRNLRLTNEHIVRIYDFLEDRHIAAITMEYVDGESLAARKQSLPRRHLECAELLPLVRQLCEALHYAHTQPRIVHRDLKPANLMVTRDGRVKITDFGIARSISDSFSRVSNAQPTSGTLVYMSPQQLQGEPAKPADDIYSIGATIFDLLTTKPPFYSGSIVFQILNVDAPSMTDRREQLEVPGETIPAIWEEVVACCLAKDPKRRPATAMEIIQRLELGLGSQLDEQALTRTQPVPYESGTNPAQFAAPYPPSLPGPLATVPGMVPPPTPGTAPGTPLFAQVPPSAPGLPPASTPGYFTPPPQQIPSRGWGFGILVAVLTFLCVGALGLAGYFAFRAGLFTAGNGEAPAPPTVIPSTPVDTRPGRLMVNTIPSGARILVDSHEAGNSPILSYEVAPGDHRIRVEKPGYEVLELAISVDAAQKADPGALQLVPLPKPTPAATPAPVVQATPTPRPSPDDPPRYTETAPTYYNPPPPPPQRTGISEKAVTSLINRWLEGTEQRDLSTIASCYSNPVDYYDEGTLTSGRLQASLRSYFSSWPYFDIQVIKSQMQDTGDPDEKVVHLTYQFVAKSGRKVSSGVAHDTMYIRDFSEGPAIHRIRQTVTDRKKNF